ncbi:thiol peroxidase [Maridesulfovibrio hydrothermalis]|uniref:Thiol peroxidase n=1 Tax=Maridesulfovibrio hydrothermalis AM13 = DSM 14728 TaxID=1121451 RepID=L0R7K1_9BACT|nr:thiol peroxidase [Maridesulfovibrio hydrothermalis]CCO22708.1 putative peroxiredoxin [Maridesulfovibrio hydrothermalis AM13 = DSM 14728]
MNERSGVITFQGNPLTLLGDEIKVGDKAPEFSATDNGLAPKTLADYAGKVLILSAVPSLDTPVCDMETRRFNNEAANLGDEIKILTLSMDLPFAQARWCGAAGVEAVETLSDYMSSSFGEAYGVLIKELRLLSRAVFVVDKAGVVQYAQYLNEITEEPDYDSALAAAKKLV